METEPVSATKSDVPSLQQLQEEHTRYSRQLESLIGKPYLSEDEKLEEVRLKKLKLRLKDQISALLQSSGGAVPAR